MTDLERCLDKLREILLSTREHAETLTHRTPFIFPNPEAPNYHRLDRPENRLGRHPSDASTQV